MKFFSNKISVNGSSRSFNDIIQDVAGGMKKQASAVDAPEVLEKEAKKELPAFIKEKIEERKGHEGGDSVGEKPAKGEVPPQLAKYMKKKNKKAGSDDIVKVADVIKVNDDEVLLVLAEGKDCDTDVDIEDDSTDEAIAEAMGAVAAAGCGYDSKESGSCEACGTSYAAGEAEEAGGMTEEAGWSAKAASESPKFVKIANLTDKQKGKFRSYWSNIWPKDFIDAVLDTEN